MHDGLVFLLTSFFYQKKKKDRDLEQHEDGIGIETYPDGGIEAWLVVVGSWCAMVPSMGLLNTLAVLHAWVSKNELPDLSKAATGWIFSTYAFFLYFCGAQVGE